MAHASDDFNRANENPLAGNWETLYGANAQISSSAVIVAGGYGGIGAVGWKASTNDFGDDQYSQIKISTANAGDYNGVILRGVSTGGGQGYTVEVRSEVGDVRIRAISGGGPDTLSTISATFASGDILRAYAAANGANVDIAVFKNGVQVGSTYTDTFYKFTGGQPGFWYSFQNTNGTITDDWYGGDGTEPPAAVTPTGRGLLLGVG